MIRLVLTSFFCLNQLKYGIGVYNTCTHMQRRCESTYSPSTRMYNHALRHSKLKTHSSSHSVYYARPHCFHPHYSRAYVNSSSIESNTAHPAPLQHVKDRELRLNSDLFSHGLSKAKPVTFRSPLYPYRSYRVCEYGFGHFFRLDRLGDIWSSFISSHASYIPSPFLEIEHARTYKFKHRDDSTYSATADLHVINASNHEGKWFSMNSSRISIFSSEHLSLPIQHFPLRPLKEEERLRSWERPIGWEYLHLHDPSIFPHISSLFNYSRSWMSTHQNSSIGQDVLSERRRHIPFLSPQNVSHPVYPRGFFPQKTPLAVDYALVYNPTLLQIDFICRDKISELVISFRPGGPNLDDCLVGSVKEPCMSSIVV